MMNNSEIMYRMAQANRQLAWRIMVYLKAHPDILNTKNNQEVFDAVREIQIGYHIKHTPKYTREDAEAFVDFMSDLEAKNDGVTYFVEQQEMDLYRPSVKKDKDWESMFLVTLLCYDSDCYTKEVHEIVLAEEEKERNRRKNID